MAAPLVSLVVLTGDHSAPRSKSGRLTSIAVTPPALRRPVSRQTALIFRSIPQHRCDLVQASDAGVHFHRLVQTIDVRTRIAVQQHSRMTTEARSRLKASRTLVSTPRLVAPPPMMIMSRRSMSSQRLYRQAAEWLVGW